MPSEQTAKDMGLSTVSMQRASRSWLCVEVTATPTSKLSPLPFRRLLPPCSHCLPTPNIYMPAVLPPLSTFHSFSLPDAMLSHLLAAHVTWSSGHGILGCPM